MKKNKSKTRLSKCFATCKFFYGEVIKERHSYLGLLILYILAAAFAPFINIIAPKYIIGELMGGQNIEKIMLLVLLLVVGNYCISVVICVLRETRNKQEDWFGRMFDMLISKKAMEMRFANTEKESSIELEQKAETGMSWYSGGVRGMSDCVVGIYSAAITFFGVVYIVVKVNPWLVLSSLAAVAVNVFCTSKINQASQEVFEKTPAINKFYHYIYTKITYREYAKELRLYDGTDLVEKKALRNAKELNKMDNECAVKQFLWGTPGVIISALSYGFNYCCLGVMATKGDIGVSELVMCITALETFANGCLLPVINNFQQLVMKCNFMNSLIEFLKLDNEEQVGEEYIKREEFKEICFKHVSFKYPGTKDYILKDINLTIHKGEHLSIVGLNGAGKSTLIKLLCRLYDVTEGEICVNGRNINEYNYEEYIKILSVVFQDFKLFSYTLNENIRIGERGNNEELGEEYISEQCVAEQEGQTGNNSDLKMQNIYETSGIADWVNGLEKGGLTLLYKDYESEGVEPSGGQAQKIAIARALYHNAPVVILDEPTAALDPVAEYEIYNRFNELINNKTAIYISHRLSSCRFCDRIIVIGDKKIQETGTHEELMERNGLYAQMFRTQAGWYVEKSGEI